MQSEGTSIRLARKLPLILQVPFDSEMEGLFGGYQRPQSDLEAYLFVRELSNTAILGPSLV